MNRLGRARSLGALALVVAVFVSCRATPQAVAPGAGSIEVAKDDPPPGATNLGPVVVEHGHGCGLAGARGTYESALAELQNEAEARGGNYVRVTKVVEPHMEGACYEDRFIIRGVVFRLKGAPAVNPGEREEAASVEERPIAQASAAPASVAPVAAAADACSPPCSPGYACAGGTCQALCNPACGANETCGQDRTCRPTAH